MKCSARCNGWCGGIEVSDETIGLDAIFEAVTGPGHFLGGEQTLGAMQRDYVYPELSDRESPAVWQETGAEDIRERARRKARDILCTHYPSHIEPAIDNNIRERFRVLLPQSSMRAP